MANVWAIVLATKYIVKKITVWNITLKQEHASFSFYLQEGLENFIGLRNCFHIRTFSKISKDKLNLR